MPEVDWQTDKSTWTAAGFEDELAEREADKRLVTMFQAVADNDPDPLQRLVREGKDFVVRQRLYGHPFQCRSQRWRKRHVTDEMPVVCSSPTGPATR